MHWKDAARKLNLDAIDIEEILDSPDEEYSLYNFIFVCRDSFTVGIESPDWIAHKSILKFITNCLSTKYQSDGEDIAVAAGVSFAEHLFDDVTSEGYGRLHEQVGEHFYGLCRPWLEKWLDAEVFASVEGAA